MVIDGPRDFGAELRLARERSGVTLRAIADATKLSVRTLELLERNRVAQLPGGIYRRAPGKTSPAGHPAKLHLL